MSGKTPKRPIDANQLAKSVVDLATDTDEKLNDDSLNHNRSCERDSESQSNNEGSSSPTKD